MKLYSTTQCHAVQQPRAKRRRIGQMSDRLKNELQAMDLHTATRIKIAASIAVISLLNNY